MFPRLPGMKSAIFTRRIILFNETFPPLGHDKPYGYIWHEATCEDICNTFCNFLDNPIFQDVTDVTFWVGRTKIGHIMVVLYIKLIRQIH